MNVFRFVTEESVEEKIIERATKKLALDALVIQKGRLLEQEKAVSAAELQSMVRFGAEYIFKSTESTITGTYQYGKMRNDSPVITRVVSM